MKPIYLIILLLFAVKGIAQTPINTINLCSGLTEEDVPDNTYFKDINHAFNNFVGTWIWTNGDEIVTFKLTKVTKRYFPDEKIYEDFMIGNYSYSTDGDNTYVVNTITIPVNEDPEANPMYNPCPEDDSNRIDFSFEDVGIDKGYNYCTATFEFLSNSTTQMQVTLDNPKELTGRLNGEPPFNPNFTIPTNMVLTKQ